MILVKIPIIFLAFLFIPVTQSMSHGYVQLHPYNAYAYYEVNNNILLVTCFVSTFCATSYDLISITENST